VASSATEARCARRRPAGKVITPDVVGAEIRAPSLRVHGPGVGNGATASSWG
jgi:hypothetical protein